MVKTLKLLNLSFDIVTLSIRVILRIDTYVFIKCSCLSLY